MKRVIDRGFFSYQPALLRETDCFAGRKLMKPIGELNRGTVMVLYWVLFGGGGNFRERRIGVGSVQDGLGQWLAAGKWEDAVRGRAQVVSRRAARGVVAEWAHTSSEPCLEGSAGGA